MAEPTPTPSPDKHELLLSRAIGALPLRRAPATLESRVLGELKRLAALPWWRRSFSHWPTLARVGFLLVSAGLIGATLVRGGAAVAGASSLDAPAARLLAWLHTPLTLMSSAGAVSSLIARLIPPLWLYAGLAIGAVWYAALFGLGAAAYRTLYLQPSSGR